MTTTPLALPARSGKLEYSRFDREIVLVRFKLKYIRRKTKRIQRKYHGVETKYMRMQALTHRCALKHITEISPKRFVDLETKIQYLSDQFSRLFECQEKLQTYLEQLICEDASGRTLLEHYTDETMLH